MQENRYTAKDMREVSEIWDSSLKQVLDTLPEDWIKESSDKVMNK